jgi:hypothetical protein
LGLLLAACGCSSDGEDETFDIASGTLSGKIGGADFALVAAETDSFLSDESGIWADLYAEPITNACQAGPAGNKNHLILSLPNQPGDYRMSLSLNATFVVEGAQTDNLIATRGRLVIDEVTATHVRGGVHVLYDAANEVSGKFQVAVCP